MDPDVFHPDLRSVARFLPRAPVGPATRPLMRLLGRVYAASATRGTRIENLGTVTVRVHRPPPTSSPPAAPGLLWIHGGGFVIGTAAQDDALCRHLSQSLGLVVASVEYRLAPEHRFPAALEDCYTALQWMARQPYVDSSRLAIGGASAGGGLAAALALLARDRGELHPVLQLLAYPMLDDRTATRADPGHRHRRLWDNRANRYGWDSYLGIPAGSPTVSPLAAPARQTDLEGLPPAWIGVGTLDLFYDEDTAYADRLRDAGIACTLSTVEGAFHGFDLIKPKAEVSRQFRSDQAAALLGAFEARPGH